MTTSSPETLALLRRAAQLRAAATPWADAATQLALDADELHRLVAEHERDYERFARRARAEVIRDAFHEAIAVLRVQLKVPDHVGFLSATTIIRYELARMRQGAKAAAEQLERGSRRSKRKSRSLTVGAEESPFANMSELPKLPDMKEVIGAQKPAQASAPRVAPPPAPVTPPPASTPPKASAPPAAPVAANNKAPLTDTERRKQQLLMQAALRRPITAPLKRGERPMINCLPG